ncbi:vWA domain-containing protein [Catenulispora subtropica]|uniref:VWFA domain-containing protein n=1 Tax=Catenulispora subtropica TaxID=450798 RepID=A0ABP5DPW4_9ACTN
MSRRHRLAAGLSVIALALGGTLAAQTAKPSTASAFGTINGLGQRSEHERITRAALACAPGVKSTGDCFEPRSMDQLAGHSGTFGAVGSPDLDEFNDPAAHCDNADYLNVAGYPQSRATATANLLACVNHLRQRFGQGVDGAAGLFDSNGDLRGDQVDITSDCTFGGGFSGRAKCNAIEGLGRALHGAQDFYSHSNWADQSDPSKPISISNPPGLGLPGPSPILDLAGTSTPAIPTDLTTGYYAGIFSDKCPGKNRVTHACMNKDEALIDPASGAASDPRTPRGQIGSNEQAAVSGAIAETRRQWSDFKTAIINRYGADLGNRMILAICQDVPKVDLVFAIDTTGSMSPYIDATVTAANTILDDLSGKGTPARLADFRIGLVDYKDVDSEIPGCPPDYDAVVDLNFATKRTDIVNALGTLPGKVGGGCDIPEDVLSGVQTAVNYPWRNGVTKAIVTMGDAPGHDPENHSGLTSASVIAAANAVDPASVYPILVGYDTSATSFMTHLATGTGGQTFSSNAPGGVGGALVAAITQITNTPPGGDTTPPTVKLTFPTAPGSQEGVFNASQTPVTGTVTATDPSGVRAIDCTDGLGGLAEGPMTVDATGKATRTLSVTGDGQHIVVCGATDDSPARNTGAADGSDYAAALELDSAPPTVACSVTPSEIWPPDKQMIPVEATVTVDDAFSGPAGFTLKSVTANEPIDPGDIQGFSIGTPDTSGSLLAGRLGSGGGRVYTLTYEGVDMAGNTATCSTTVTVPHNQ